MENGEIFFPDGAQVNPNNKDPEYWENILRKEGLGARLGSTQTQLKKHGLAETKPPEKKTGFETYIGEKDRLNPNVSLETERKKALDMQISHDAIIVAENQHEVETVETGRGRLPCQALKESLRGSGPGKGL